jgi:hypothetical protein
MKMPSTIASVTDLVIDDFNSATEFGEFTIAASPKLSDDAARMSTGSLMPSDGIDFVLDLGGSDASSPDRFPTETVKMTYGAIEWTYAPGDFSPDGRDALPLEQVSDPGSQHELEHVSFTYQKIVGEYHGNDGDIVHPLESLHPGFDLMF